MTEIKPNELQAGQVYYIESLCPYTTISPTGHPKIQKQKGVFKCIPVTREAYDMVFTVFEDVVNIHTDDFSGPGHTGIVSYPIDYYKFYLNEKEPIQQNTILPQTPSDAHLPLKLSQPQEDLPYTMKLPQTPPGSPPHITFRRI